MVLISGEGSSKGGLKKKILHKYYQNKLKDLKNGNQLVPENNHQNCSGPPTSSATFQPSHRHAGRISNDMTLQSDTPSSNRGPDLTFEQPLDLRTMEKKLRDPGYLDAVLTAYYGKNKHPSATDEQKISFETQIPVHLISDWYTKQWQRTEREKLARIRRSEPELLKCLDENQLFTDEVISNLVARTELSYDEVLEWVGARACERNSRRASGDAWKQFSIVDMDLRSVPVEPGEPTWCFCERVSFGEMVMCDNDQV